MINAGSSPRDRPPDEEYHPDDQSRVGGYPAGGAGDAEDAGDAEVEACRDQTDENYGSLWNHGSAAVAVLVQLAAVGAARFECAAFVAVHPANYQL